MGRLPNATDTFWFYVRGKNFHSNSFDLRGVCAFLVLSSRMKQIFIRKCASLRPKFVLDCTCKIRRQYELLCGLMLASGIYRNPTICCMTLNNVWRIHDGSRFVIIHSSLKMPSRNLVDESKYWPHTCHLFQQARPHDWFFRP